MEKKKKKKITLHKSKQNNLDRDGGWLGMVLADNNVIGQDDNVGLNILRHALGASRRQVQPYTLAPPQKDAAQAQKDGSFELRIPGHIPRPIRYGKAAPDQTRGGDE